MKIKSRRMPWLASTAFVLAGLIVAPAVEAARGGGHGGGHAGGHGGGGGGRPQADHSRADKRSTNVRNTSVNNVNVNRNVDVHVDNDGCCHNGWDDDFHPVATAAAVTATVAVTSAIVGSIVRTVPPGCVPVSYAGMIYQQCGGTWYQPQGTQFIIVNAPY